MRTRYRERIPADLEGIAAKLTEQRATVDDPGLDALKRRVLARAGSDRAKHTFITSRLAGALTLLAVLGGSGGAVAIAQLDSHSNTYGGAASAQYTRHKHKRPTCHTNHASTHKTHKSNKTHKRNKAHKSNLNSQNSRACRSVPHKAHAHRSRKSHHHT